MFGANRGHSDNLAIEQLDATILLQNPGPNHFVIVFDGKAMPVAYGRGINLKGAAHGIWSTLSQECTNAPPECVFARRGAQALPNEKDGHTLERSAVEATRSKHLLG